MNKFWIIIQCVKFFSYLTTIIVRIILDVCYNDVIHTLRELLIDRFPNPVKPMTIVYMHIGEYHSDL